MRIWLASASSRRFSWLNERIDGIYHQGLDDIDESISHGTVEEQVLAICQKKAAAVTREHDFDYVIVADTLVEDPDDENLALGKPTDELAAATMLLRLRARRHRVFSATGIQHDGEWEFFVESAVVEIADYSDDVLVELIESKSWQGKAGAYDLAGAMGDFAQLVDGAEICVLGFASLAIDELLRKI
jgi:predicted house-cleaning NTP pyrophosphatase (Maf/HAM1 superfamily)